MCYLLTNDIPTALDQADKSAAQILQALGIENPPQQMASWVFDHPYPSAILLIPLFVVGAGISWGVERAYLRWKGRKRGTDANMPMWQAVQHVADVRGDRDERGCFPETLKAIRQEAVDDRLHIWGKRELEQPSPRGYASDVWTPIDLAYWRDHKINSMATGETWDQHDHSYGEPLNIHSQDRYWSLRVQRSEIEDIWPPLKAAERKVRAKLLEQHLVADRAEALRELAALKHDKQVNSLPEIWEATRHLEQIIDAIGWDDEGRRYYGRMNLHFQALKTAQHTKADIRGEMDWRNDEISYHHPMLGASILALDRWLRGQEAAQDFAEAVARLERLKPDMPAQQRFTPDSDSQTFQLIRTAHYDKEPERPFRRALKGDAEGASS